MNLGDHFRVAILAGIVTAASAAFAVGAAITSSDSATATPPADAATSTSVSTGTSTGTSTAAPTDTGAAPATMVTIDAFEFSPIDVTVASGASITWTNNESVTHNVATSDGLFGSDDLELDDTYTVTVVDAGTIEYYCGIHQFMLGTVTVMP